MTLIRVQALASSNPIIANAPAAWTNSGPPVYIWHWVRGLRNPEPDIASINNRSSPGQVRKQGLRGEDRYVV